MTDELDVIRRVLEGDPEPFQWLVARYAGPVLRLIQNVAGNSHLCEDIAQAVFLVAYANLRSFDPDRSRFSTWLFTTARSKSINATQKKEPIYLAEAPDQTREPLATREPQRYSDAVTWTAWAFVGLRWKCLGGKGNVQV